MQFGFILPNILSTVGDASGIKNTARLAEDVGFDSLWVSDHILMPAAKAQYGSGTEALMTLAFAAGITQRVALGLSVLILPMRNPLIVAKELASLHELSGRRPVIAGVGVGWSTDEYGYLNADFQRRGKLADEYITIMRKLWTDEHPAHSGTHNFSGVMFSPRPMQPLPIWIGGESEAAIRRAATLGDGYQPTVPESIGEFAANVRRLREWSAGRAVTISLSITFDMSQGAQAVIDELGAYREAGLEYPAMRFKHASLGELLAHIETFAREVMPALRS